METNFKGTVLVKIIHSEFNVFQAVSTDGKVVRLYEQKNGNPIGIKDMRTKVIHPLTNPYYNQVWQEIRNNSVIN